jgi:hypothetical protein
MTKFRRMIDEWHFDKHGVGITDAQWMEIEKPIRDSSNCCPGNARCVDCTFLRRCLLRLRWGVE